MTRETKKAQRATQEAQDAERIRAALRWTEPAAGPDVMPPEGVYGSDGLSTGWTFNVYTRRVDVACSSSASHAIGRTDRTNAQRPRWLYSTKRLALLALRNAMEAEFAQELAKVDRMIKEKSA